MHAHTHVNVDSNIDTNVDKHRNTYPHVDKNAHVHTQAHKVNIKDLDGKGGYKISKWKRVTGIPHTREI